MMTDSEILAAVAELARDKLEWNGPVRPDMHLVEDLKLDSLRLLTLAVEVENRFRICLEEEEEESIETVEDLVGVIRSKQTRDTVEGRAGKGPGAP